jgi:hypothetical protein
MILTEEQANQIARGIVWDIQQYIRDNQKEYEKFLEEERIQENEQE